MQTVMRGARLAALAAGVLAGGTLAATTAAAQTVTLGAVLNGAQERPTPVTTTGFGFGQLTYNQATDLVTISLTVRNLTSNTVAVGAGGSSGHVHVVTMADGTGPIAVPLVNATTLTADQALLGVRGFDYAQSFTLAQVGSIANLNQSALSTLRTRLIAAIGAPQGTGVAAYFNVHTTAFPSGEIRGDLAVVPEPSTYALMGTGLAGLGLAARRRRAVKA